MIRLQFPDNCPATIPCHKQFPDALPASPLRPRLPGGEAGDQAVFRKSLLIVFLLPCILFASVAAGQQKNEITAALDSSVRVNSYWPTQVGLLFSPEPRDAKRVLTYTVVSEPKHGKIVMPKKHNKYYYLSRGQATYISEKGYVGEDSLTWKINDGQGDSQLATLSITVRASEPVPQEQNTALVVEGETVVLPLRYLGGGGYDTTIHFSKPAHGTATLQGEELHYKPNPGYQGTDTFQWHLRYTKQGAKESRTSKLVRCWIVVKKTGMTDWPQWRADAWRSGFTSMELPAELHLQWRRQIPKTESLFLGRGENIYPDINYCRPVQMGKTLYVPETANDCLSAYDTETGNLRWRFFSSGALRRPPLAVELPDGREAVIVSSDDSCVTCLDAVKGTPLWKFRAAPNKRTAMGFGRLCSVWPILASPVASEGKIYFTAGYVPAFALYAYCLDAATGKVVWVNDGRINDIWNTSALSPLAVSYDNAKIFGAVEGASRPWVLDSRTGRFLGHVGVGYTFPGSGNAPDKLYPQGVRQSNGTKRKGEKGWYVDGNGSFNIPDPVEIMVAAQRYTAERVKSLGVSGTVASLLAGDGKLFVSTAEGELYCFAGRKIASPKNHVVKNTALATTDDRWTKAATAMAAGKDSQHGLALVLGIETGRLVEELARESSMMIVVVDENHNRLQRLREKMYAAGIAAHRVSILEGNPAEFLFAPYQAVLICSERELFSQQTTPRLLIDDLYRYAHPYEGEIWIPTNSRQHALLEQRLKNLKNVHYKISRHLLPVGRAEGLTHIRRTNLSAEERELKPPFGLIAFGSAKVTAPYMAPDPRLQGLDTYNWLSWKERRSASSSSSNPAKLQYDDYKGYPTISTVSTSQSIFGSMNNPLYATTEKFVGLPSTGSDSACSAKLCRFRDYGLTHGKIASVFDASANYWGRMIFPQIGGCPGRTTAGEGIFTFSTTPVPGSACGCSAAMQYSNFSIVPLPYEETWVNYQRERTSGPVEETAIKRIGINFGAPGDRYLPDESLLWTHHPYAGRYGFNSHNPLANPEALPLVPVRYQGSPTSVYHHSAQMHRSQERYRGWVAASYVKGMSEIEIPLAQAVVALRTDAPPQLDGKLEEPLWNDSPRVDFTPNKVSIDNDRIHLPDIGETCYAMFRYDETNLYVAAGTNAKYGDPKNSNNKKFVTLRLNSRERIADDLVLTGAVFTGHYRNKPPVVQKTSSGVAPTGWDCRLALGENEPFAAEFVIPWKTISAAGLWKEQLILNVTLSESHLTKEYLPLYLDRPRSPFMKPRPYTVRMYFAEMEDKQAGQRLFDVSLQGKTVLPKLDVVKQAGLPRREWMQEFRGIQIADRLNVGFRAISGEPMLSGIEILGEYEHTSSEKNNAPTAAIEASVLSGPAPLEVRFSARKSADADGQIAESAWLLGDGRLATGSQLQHVFAEAGTYQVHLLVRDNRGAMATDRVTITVTPGKPATFVCKIRARGGDFSSLSDWEQALRSDLTSAATKFRLKSPGTYVAADNGQPVTFASGATGVLESIVENVATISQIQGVPKPGKVSLASGHQFVVQDGGVATGRSLLFPVQEIGNYQAADNGKTVTFTGQGTGTLRHINRAGLAYVTDCQGTIRPGPVQCASGHLFRVADSGNPIYSLVAECYHDWPDGLSENLTIAQGDWICSPMRCVTIRAAKGSEHAGIYPDKQRGSTGFALYGNLDLTALRHLRIEKISMPEGKTLVLGPGSSVNRLLAGRVKIAEQSMVANSIADQFTAYNAHGRVNHSFSSLATGYRLVRRKIKIEELAKTTPANIRFYHCTGKTFDPGNQAEVHFVHCLAAPGGKGFYSKHYSEPASTYHCVSADDTATVWDKGNGDEKNLVHQTIKFVNPAAGDFHLHPADTTARQHAAAGLGADIDGEPRTGARVDVGADSLPAKENN